MIRNYFLSTLTVTFLWLGLGLNTAQAAPPGAQVQLHTNDKAHAAGTDATPYFGWHVQDVDQNEIQSAYQLLVSTDPKILNEAEADRWNSGKISDRQQNYVYYAGKALQAGKRYFWKVRTWDKDGQVGPWSAVSQFDTGLFAAADWKGASWIKRDNQEANDYTYFRKQVNVGNKSIKRAMVYLSAYHSYEFYINGKAIGKGAAFHYPQYAYYKTYDVTKDLQSGQNTLAALSHWYGGGQGRPKGERGFILKLQVEYNDGTMLTLGTDNSWKQHAAEGFLVNTRRRNGEGIGYIDIIDSRKLLQNWQAPAFDDRTWAAASVIGAHPTIPFTGLQPDLTELVEQTIKPLSVKKIGKDCYVIDLGKIYAGVPSIAFTGGVAGDTVSMHGGFILDPDGKVSKKVNQSTDLSYQFVLNGQRATFQPIVYLGYRYLQVDHSPMELTAGNVRFITRYFELQPERAQFQSSNTMLNQVWQLMTHSLALGAQESFVDTPTREKGAFLGDGWSQSVVTMSTMGERALTLRVLLEFLDSQEQYWSQEGALNSVYPNVDGKRDIPDYTQQYLLWVWDYYLQTGNTAFLRDNYEKLKKIALYVADSSEAKTGLIHNLKGGSGPYKYGIVDWPPAMRYGYDMNTEARTVINAYAYADFDIMAGIAQVTGHTTDVALFNQKAHALKDAFNKHLLNDAGVYIDGLLPDGTASNHVSQHANMFPLALHMVPAQYIKTVTEQVRQAKMNAGMVTVRFLLEALGEQQQGKQLLELMTNPAWDGWAKTVAKGGTATWESWDADQNNNSLSHPWGASGLLGIQRYILGIKPLSAQNQLVQVKPLDMGEELASASGVYTTDQGDIRTSWKQSATNYTLEVNLPVNIRARVYVPKGKNPGTSVTVNGKVVQGTLEGDYILIGSLGSGHHQIVR